MGLFRGIKNVINKNSAAMVVRNLLEIEAKEGNFFGDLASTPNLMVAAAWRKTPQLLDGRSGLHPHKISIVAATFASGIDDLEQSNPNIRCFTTCLIKAMNNAAKNSNTYPLNAIDNQLLGAASDFLAMTIKTQNASPLSQDIKSLLDRADEKWTVWIRAYKDSAAKNNPVLAINEKGFSLIDILDDEPLRRAFRDGMEPQALGKEFAENFDISKIQFQK